MFKPILFISDLHLDMEQPHITQLFLQFLESDANQAQALYILGDLFETWIGDDDPSVLNQQIQFALKKLTAQGIPVFIMHGNRDFLLGSRFIANTGCQLIKDPTQIDLFGTPTLLMHGDTLCTDDVGYQKFRRCVRNPFLKSFYLSLPLSWREKIARKMRTGSQQHTSNTAIKMMDVNEQAVKNVMQKYNACLLIHGHTHRPGIHELNINNKTAKRIVLGAWHNDGSVLVCRKGEQPRLALYN